MVVIDAPGTGIVGRQCLDDIVVVALQQLAQVAGASFHIGPGVKRVRYAEGGSGVEQTVGEGVPSQAREILVDAFVELGDF